VCLRQGADLLTGGAGQATRVLRAVGIARAGQGALGPGSNYFLGPGWVGCLGNLAAGTGGRSLERAHMGGNGSLGKLGSLDPGGHILGAPLWSPFGGPGGPGAGSNPRWEGEQGGLE